MADTTRRNLVFETESIVAQHAIFGFLINTLNNQIIVKYQSTKTSPFDTHNGVMSTFWFSLFMYATASMAEVDLRARGTVYKILVGYIRLFASALAVILLLVILAPVSGCIVSIVWACFLGLVVYESYQELYQVLRHATGKGLDLLKFFGIIKSNTEEPNQANDQHV